MKNFKELLIKTLDENNHKESALLLQNWNELDSNAKLFKSILEKSSSSLIRDLTGGKENNINPVSGKGKAVIPISENKVRVHYDAEGAGPTDFNETAEKHGFKRVANGVSKQHKSHYVDLERVAKKEDDYHTEKRYAGIFNENDLISMHNAPTHKHSKAIAHSIVDGSSASDDHKKALKSVIDQTRDRKQLVGSMRDAHLHDPHR